VVLGRSLQGRPIKAVRVGDPDSERKAIVVGAIHGSERQGLRITRAIRRRDVSGVDLWVVDAMNPDGVANGTRGNARGVDLNRNWSYRWQRGSGGYYGGTRPFSEPETRVMRRLIRRLRPAVTIWYHQPWNAVLAPCGGRHAVQRRYARRARMRLSCRGAGLPGTATSWQRRHVRGSTPFVVELPARSVSSGSIRRHARAALAAAAGR
jgi:protein MpaA